MPVLIDTSSWIQMLRRKGDEDIRRRVVRLLLSGDATWCDIVRLELWSGAKGDDERDRLREMDIDLPKLELNSEVWDEACSIGFAARSAGMVVPHADIVIFACAKVHRVRLEHADRHYDLLGQLRGTL